jgi:hypothetical protein
MADPLCLPRTTDGWNEMKSYVLDFIRENCGNPTNNSLLVNEDNMNDGMAYFVCRVFCKKSGKLVDIVGCINACWDKTFSVYLNVVFPKQISDFYNIKPFHIWL